MSDGTEQERRKNVFVVYGRNEDARFAMFEFLRSAGLNPIEWGRARALTQEASPYIGTTLDAAFNAAQAFVVLLTPDEIVRLRPEYSSGESDPDLKPSTQARPNVLFEAGMAIGKAPDRTVLVELGHTRGLSDLSGRDVVRMGNAIDQRQELLDRLRGAGCNVDSLGTDWHTSGRFEVPAEPELAPEDDATSGRQSTIGVNDGWTKSGRLYLKVNEPKSLGFGMFSVIGEAYNDGPDMGFSFITATYTDESGTIIGQANGPVNQLQSGETKTITLSSNDDLTLGRLTRLQSD